MIAMVRKPRRENSFTTVSRSCAMRRTLVAGSRTSVPESRLMWASHDSPPNVVDSTNADAMRRPVSLTAASNRRRDGTSASAKASRSQLTAPYDSRKTTNTSAPATRDRSERIAGGGPRSRTPAPLAS